MYHDLNSRHQGTELYLLYGSEIPQKDPDTACVCCAVALTVYFAAQYMVLNYVRKLSSVGHWWSHLKQLWFANVANNILWWAYIKACFRVARAYYGRGLEFKSTAKGKGAIAVAAWNLFQDLGIPGACLLLLLISLGEP